MKRCPPLLALALAAVGLSHWASAAHLANLRVLYIGEPGSLRAQHFQGFLHTNVGHIRVASRATFKPAEADDADVVLLDWPQSGNAREERQARAPLGDRGDWTKSTVLLGSAGLNLAVAWKARGGFG
jgi:hypothetical protein